MQFTPFLLLLLICHKGVNTNTTPTAGIRVHSMLSYILDSDVETNTPNGAATSVLKEILKMIGKEVYSIDQHFML